MNVLLKNIMMDACQKMQGEEVLDLPFLTTLKMKEYLDILIEEGKSAHEKIEKDAALTQELKEIFAIPYGNQIVSRGASTEDLAKMLSTKYFASNPQGIYAMANYIAIRAWYLYQENMEGGYWCIDDTLTAWIPAGSEDRYREYRDKHFPQFREKTAREEIMELEECKLGEDSGYIFVVREKLKKKILDAPNDVLKQVIEKVSDSYSNWRQLSFVIRFTTIDVREKLFSCMTEESIEECSNCAGTLWIMISRYMYVMDALTHMLIELMEYEQETI